MAQNPEEGPVTEDGQIIGEMEDKPQIAMKVSTNAKPVVNEEPVRTVKPVVFLSDLDEEDEERVFDFRPINEIEEERDFAPKVSSALAPASSSESPPEEQVPETPASAEKDNGQLKEESPGTLPF